MTRNSCCFCGAGSAVMRLRLRRRHEESRTVQHNRRHPGLHQEAHLKFAVMVILQSA
jgi:hypothetical protein